CTVCQSQTHSTVKPLDGENHPEKPVPNKVFRNPQNPAGQHPQNPQYAPYPPSFSSNYPSQNPYSQNPFQPYPQQQYPQNHHGYPQNSYPQYFPNSQQPVPQ